MLNSKKVSILSLAVMAVCNGPVYSQTGTDILLGDKKLNNETKIIKYQKQLVLDNPFLVQLYGSWKSLNSHDQKLNHIVQLTLDKDYKSALGLMDSIKLRKNPKQQRLVNSLKLYLLWEQKLPQTFFSEWVSLSANETFLGTELAIALDQILVKEDSSWFINNGITLSQEGLSALKSIKKQESRFNHLAQAYFSLRTGEEALEWIGKINPNDDLRLLLADSVILSYAKKNELANAAKLLKEIYEPALAGSDDVNALSSYHVLLARLLYQAKAYDASEHYYSLIPDKADVFLKARVEKLWISLRKNNPQQIKSELKTLGLPVFDKTFIPELQLVSGIANLRLCQFKEVENAFNTFVKINKNNIREIAKNLKSQNPAMIDPKDFFVKLTNTSIDKKKAEHTNLEALGVTGELLNSYRGRLVNLEKLSELDLISERHRKWKNRQVLIESTIKNLRFVKVEFLSQMRRLNKSISLKRQQDSVKTIASGREKSDRFSFPYDGVLFADELFHISSEVKDLCLRSKK
jgi:hypothetical protein